MNVTIPIEKLEEHAGQAQGRVVVITDELIIRGANSDALTSWIRQGGASGIGKATALLFARYG
jgi:glutamine phosphoribosylpyrophosphate amidotransferase